MASPLGARAGLARKALLSPILLLAGARPKENVGGQAVLEGVMMRGPSRWSVDVRLPDGSIASKVTEHRPWSKRNRFFGLPFVRGVLTLFESLVLGYRALDYSAAMNQDQGKATPPDGQKPQAKGPAESMGLFSILLTLVLSFLLAAAVFVALPHLLSIAFGARLGFDEKDLPFHIMDGLIKFAFFLAYVWGIGKIPDIRRVYSYHGAEHRAIYAYEAGLPLEPVMARHFPLWHPRCGTAFMFLLLALSILFYAIVFPILINGVGAYHGMEGFVGLGAFKRTLYSALLKIALALPLAGISYEISRQAGKPKSGLLWRALIFPGLLIQRLTTKETDDGQLEVALRALSEALGLKQESAPGAGGEAMKALEAFGSEPCTNTTYN
ncbi:MAG: DUF1385 domain-containing protein [Deltaproteobacteria bacterium]|nr:DUF1385 domain-containing protein [Deltaproteobacteria bacterium]